LVWAEKLKASGKQNGVEVIIVVDFFLALINSDIHM
jgi:hypothetical protein